VNSRKVLIIGLDGATFDLMRPWMAQGDLPNLARMAREGSHGELTSTIHPITGAAWPSFMTGVQQGKHSVYDFIRRTPNGYNFVLTNADDIAAPTVFDLVSQHGRHVIALNVPVTFPPRAVNGIMVSGLFAQPAPAIAYPRSVYRDLVRILGEYVIMPSYNRWAGRPLDDYVAQLHSMSDQHLRAMQYLLQTAPWDLACVVFTATDLAQHAFWKFMEEGDPQYGGVIREVYRQLDRHIGALQSQVGAETLTIIMSDHGAGPLESFVQLNRWLSDEGFLRFLPQHAGWRARLVRAAWTGWRRVLPPRLIGNVRARVGARYNAMRDRMESALFATRIDWPRTRAYALGACGNVYVNLAGREPQGAVQPGVEYEHVCAEIRERLLALKDPLTGQLLVADVLPRDQVYHGAYIDQAPDLVVCWRDYRYWGRGRYDFDGPDVFHRQRKWDFSDLPLTATHRMNGIFLASGTDIQPQSEPARARIIDIAPTILSVLGIPVPADMDGRVLSEIFSIAPEVGVAEAEQFRHAGSDDVYSPDEATAIEERLKALGYL
jgi:predicted AlkP superfamily phosphohydrolase/phosphomutase